MPAIEAAWQQPVHSGVLFLQAARPLKHQDHRAALRKTGQGAAGPGRTRQSAPRGRNSGRQECLANGTRTRKQLTRWKWACGPSTPILKIDIFKAERVQERQRKLRDRPGQEPPRKLKRCTGTVSSAKNARKRAESFRAHFRRTIAQYAFSGGHTKNFCRFAGNAPNRRLYPLVNLKQLGAEPQTTR